MPLMGGNNLNADDIRKIIQEELKQANFHGDASKQKQVFISHSFASEDFTKSQLLQKSLKSKNIDAYLAEDDKQYGYLLSDKIRERITESVSVIVLLTKNSISSPSVNQEVGYALGLGMTIIPMVSEDVKDDVGVLLKHIEGEYFTEDNFEEKCEVLSDNLSKKLDRLEKPSTNKVESLSQERGGF